MKTQIPQSSEASFSVPSHPLRNDQDLDILIKEIGDSRIVLLGESTHGTHEYYEWRMAITKRLIREKGFKLVAVEGDWTDSYNVDQFIRGPQQDSAAIIKLLKQYDRWPSSMWGNYEMLPLLQWMNTFNQQLSVKDQLRFYGLDLYGFWKWTGQDLSVKDTAVLQAVKQVKDIFAPFNNDALQYANSVRKTGSNFRSVTDRLLKTVLRLTNSRQPGDEEGFRLYQQALLSFHGEHYFRTMVGDKVQAINMCDGYMAETVKRLLHYHGSEAKLIVWAHNGHTGNARYSNMSEAGYTSMGEILDRDLGHNKIFSVGFGTYKGDVLAGYTWGGVLQKIRILPAKENSWESILHNDGPENKIILSKELLKNNSFTNWIEFRSIGAAFTGAAIYGRSIIPQRFDSFIFIDSTSALRPVK